MISFACDRCDARAEMRAVKLPPGWSTRIALGMPGRELDEVLCRACDATDDLRQREERTERMVRSARDLRRKPDDSGQGSLL
ncbi:MAG: hypothetical protein H6724_13605 [Sandaracinus sp.]|nr:hypothetical protein [Sandaracinus sp.]MCB9620468.1 hypothetical protein [Sandaracinus sp.]MCB9624676.1 hypothetical protein [Sandaracinus sp.]